MKADLAWLARPLATESGVAPWLGLVLAYDPDAQPHHRRLFELRRAAEECPAAHELWLQMVRIVAAEYADRPGYRESWR